MHSSTWKEFYGSDVQGFYALVAVPVLFLIYRAVRGRPRGGLLPRADGFVDGYAIAFAFETILDPLVTTLTVRALGIADGVGGTVLLITFVVLGDFRVYLLLFGLLAIARGGHWSDGLATAVGWSFVVPVVAYAADSALHAAVGGLGANSIWIIYEALFLAIALWLRSRLVPARVPASEPALRRYLRALLLYVAVYYAGWLFADLLIQIGGFDFGWLIRVIPNQLYYAFWVPVVFFAFFARRYASTSTSTQAVR